MKWQLYFSESEWEIDMGDKRRKMSEIFTESDTASFYWMPICLGAGLGWDELG